MYCNKTAIQQHKLFILSYCSFSLAHRRFFKYALYKSPVYFLTYLLIAHLRTAAIKQNLTESAATNFLCFIVFCCACASAFTYVCLPPALHWSWQICRNGRVTAMVHCGGHPYNPRTQLCCQGTIHRKRPANECCQPGTKTYNPDSQTCCNGQVFDNKPQASFR